MRKSGECGESIARKVEPKSGVRKESEISVRKCAERAVWEVSNKNRESIRMGMAILTSMDGTLSLHFDGITFLRGGHSNHWWCTKLKIRITFKMPIPFLPPLQAWNMSLWNQEFTNS